MVATIKDSLFAVRRPGAAPSTRSLASSTSILHVSEAEEQQIMFSAASLLTQCSVLLLRTARQASANASTAPQEPAFPGDPLAVSGDAVKAAAVALETANVEDLFVPSGGAEELWEDERRFTGQNRYRQRRPLKALAVLERELRNTQLGEKLTLMAQRPDFDAVNLLFPAATETSSVCSNAPVSPLSPVSRALLIFSALWLSLKFWAVTRISVSLNRVIFECMEARSASLSARSAHDHTAFGGENDTAVVTDAKTPTTNPVGEVNMHTPLPPLPASDSTAAVQDDLLLPMQPSQWSAPRAAAGEFDCIGYAIQGIEDFEMILLRSCQYTVPLPSC